jgi:hypothetical protein
MANSGIKLDIQGFERQIEKLKMKIEIGVIEGFNEARELLQNIMKFYIEETVYSPNVYTPKLYERTGDLKENVVVSVEGDTIYVWVDSSGMDLTQDGVPYPYRVLEGHKVHPYEHTPRDGSWAGYMNERNWVEATRQEFIQHMNQSKIFLETVRRAIQKRI